MLHSPTCEHALRALIYMASRPHSGPIRVSEIADESGVSRQSMAKILHGIRRNGLVRSTKGPGGGYELARPPVDIRLIEIVDAVDGPLLIERRCVLGLDVCDDAAPCALHDHWKSFREQYLAAVSRMNLADAARTIAAKHRGSEASAVERSEW